MPDTTQQYNDLVGALLTPSGNVAQVQTAQNISSVRKLWALQAADATVMNTAGTGITTTEANVAQLIILDPSTDYRMKVSSYKIAASGAITAANTDFATFDLMYNNGNGGSFTTVATANTENKSGSLGAVTANIAAAVTVNTAVDIIPAGSQLVVRVSKSGAGKKLPQLAHVVRVVPI